MSLDISLITKTKVIREGGTGVFVRDNGQTRELSNLEVAEKFPNAIVNTQEDYETDEVFDANITHNLGKMADKADLYYPLWRPEEKGWKTAKDITPMLEIGLAHLREKPGYFKGMNPDNGWGDYDGLVSFVEDYLAACKEYPDAEIKVSR